MKKVITKEMLTQYYELDVGNCLMTKEDFCEHIAEILNKPVESKISMIKEITEYYEERDIDIFAQETADNQICNICASDFDLNSEGGISGNLGILPIALCPTCLSGMIDLTGQLDTQEAANDQAYQTDMHYARKEKTMECKECGYDFPGRATCWIGDDPISTDHYCSCTEDCDESTDEHYCYVEESELLILTKKG
tara:strand:+ start:94 stop:678 length:585 start_codon:yes stop_codon:yes gene_type:complete